MSDPLPAEDFFKVGGALAPDAPSYVVRQADEDLIQAVLSGQYCNMLTTRQMGKSSLMVRTVSRLQDEGMRTVVIDLTGIGTEVSANEWYFGLISRFKRQLELSVDEAAWWSERDQIGPVQRFSDFLRQVVLKEIREPIVVFIDEIDSTLNLSFTDDFFPAIRAAYNARADDPEFERLTFVLLGVASPPDLIKDRTRTPFNIGHGIALQEFTQTDAAVLREGLEAVYPGQGKAIFTRIYHWTSGHPYLTQKLCLAVTETRDGHWTNERVDELVERLFLSEEARKETNLQFVQDKMLTHPQRRELLNLYKKVIRGKKVQDDGQSPIQSQLKLSGLVKAENGYLHTRNRIYRRAFDLAWVRENTAVNWAPIVAGIAVFVALLAVGAILYNAWVGIQFQACVANFHQTDDPEERLAHLAKILRLRGLLGPTDYDYRARELFYGRSREEQLDLFDVYNVEHSDLIVVIGGLYETLADIDGTDSTGPLLEAMAKSLDRPSSLSERKLW